ncbi:hypothetical protein N0V90_004717 [Kalmusia sp. IMI 367209]|nr:hypothetical protein N0V90_004717 [Kalmusia sp. IMI 367209]
MADASLMGMPLELLVHLIATYLPTNDLGALRLTNRYLEKALFDTFAKEFFTKRQFMLSTPSLQTLVDISKHGALNRMLKHVIIGLEHYGDSHFRDPQLPAPTVGQREAFRNAWADQVALIFSGRGRDMLAEAFRNLPNLDTLGIRDYNAHGRVRDSKSWHSYGAPTVSRETGHTLWTGSGDFASQVFLLLIQALTDADRAVPSIEVILRAQYNGLIDFAFFLPPTSSRMELVLDGLQTLLLTLQDGKENFTDSFLLETFLLRTTFLKHLRLNFRKLDITFASNVLRRLGTSGNILPNLQRLDFGMVHTMPDLLVDLICKFASTLLHVSLWKVTLAYDGNARWTDIEHRYNPWPRVLRDLAKSVHLTSMTIGCIDFISAGTAILVKFPDEKVSQEYSGDMNTWLPQLIDDLKVPWPMSVASSDSSDNDDDDDDDDQDDEDDEDEDDEYED